MKTSIVFLGFAALCLWPLELQAQVFCKTPLFTFQPSQPVVGEEVVFTTASPNATWDFGDAARADGETVTHVYANRGSYAVVLSAETPCGPLSSPPQVVQVGALMCKVPGFAISPPNPMRRQTVTFHTDMPNPAWSFGDGATAVDNTVTHSYEDDGFYDVTVTVDTACGRLTSSPRRLQVATLCKLPDFTYTPATPLAGEDVIFSTDVPGARWDFGDGSAGEGRNVAHRYETSGTYYVTLTADTACGRLSSTPKQIVVKVLFCKVPSFQFSPAEPTNGQPITFTTYSEHASWDFGDGTTAEGSVVVHTYEQAMTYHVIVTAPTPCGTLSSDPTPVRVTQLLCKLPSPTASATDVTVGQPVAFSVAGSAPTWNFGDGTTGLGPTVQHAFQAAGLFQVKAEIGTSCGRLSSHPIAITVTNPTSDYECHATVRDGYERAIEGVEVHFIAVRSTLGPQPMLVAEKRGRTDAAGELVLSLQASGVEGLYCAVLEEHGTNLNSSINNKNGVPAGYSIRLTPMLYPRPTAQEQFEGLKGGTATAHLYQSDAYDRVVVIPEPFDGNENNEVRRRRRNEFWAQFAPALKELYRLRYDVWLVQPPTTGQNLHEQAAEYAQAVQHAVQYGPGAANGKVILFGYSMGGLVLRIASARWQADATWRQQLGLSDQLPASLVMFGDAPLRGAQVNEDIQGMGWEKNLQHERNLDSCAAQQMLQIGCFVRGLCDIQNYNNFFGLNFQGERRVEFPSSSGTCDDNSTGKCICEAGPPVFSINGDGWPHGVRMVAFSNGTWTPGYNQCYGGSKDLNVEGMDICPYDPGGAGPWRPPLGATMTEVRACSGFQDYDFKAWSGRDLAAGSRHDSITSATSDINVPIPILNLICRTVQIRQIFAGTFIPIWSALATDVPGSGPMHEVKVNNHQGTHARFYPATLLWALGEFEAASGGGPAVSVGPQAVITTSVAKHTRTAKLDGRSSLTSKSAMGRYQWQFGDGTTGSGAVATHTYASDGTFPVTLTVTDKVGSASEVRTLPVAINMSPIVEIESTSACNGDAQCAVTFSATAEDPEDDVLQYEWSGCASGSGTTAVCPASASGPQTAIVTVRDDRGGAGSSSRTVTLFATAASVGAWSSCAGTGAYVCVASGPGGCSRAGVSTRSVTETAWSFDPLLATTPPIRSQTCTQLTTGYVASYNVGLWGNCSEPCGGGWQYRSVVASSWRPTGPDAPRPGDAQPCNTSPCRLTCYDYPTCYPTKSECYGDGWRVCEIRYRDDGAGGLLTCWKGFP